jgi:hypothetical protein
MSSLLKKSFFLSDVNLYLFKENNVIFFKNILGSLKIYMPSEYFLSKTLNKTNILFVKRKMFKLFFTNFMFFFNKFFRFYFFKLRLRGLGYRIKKITTKLYRFFFAFNHYFYFHISKDIFFKHKKRNLIIFSNNLVKLNDIFSHLLLLKKLDFYERNNTFIISKKILFFKKRK